MEDLCYWESKFEPCFYSNRLLNKIELLNKSTDHKVDITEVKKAVYYARKYHGTQTRKSGEPYYSHPIEVAYMVADYAAIEAPQYYRTDLLVTSVLHDTMEDTMLTEGMIEQIFGKTVAYQVERLTRVKPYGKISSADIVELLFKKKENALLMIKLFDRLHNMQTIGCMSPEKTKKIAEETLTRFISLGMYLKTNNPMIFGLEDTLSKLCHESLSLKPQFFPNFQSFFDENYQLPWPNFQNEEVPKHLQHLLEISQIEVHNDQIFWSDI